MGFDSYLQGEYILSDEEKKKYIGKNVPFYRSSWEKRLMYYFCKNKNVLKWSNESVVVPYISPVDGRVHRYFVDFYCEILTNNGVKKFLVEVKPLKQTQLPVKPKNKNQKAYKRYMTESVTFLVNQSKWKYAEEYCKKRGIEFIVFTERDLFNE